jgi:hypothetical protein
MQVLEARKGYATSNGARFGRGSQVTLSSSASPCDTSAQREHSTKCRCTNRSLTTWWEEPEKSDPRTTKALEGLATYQGFLNGGGGRI